MPKRRCFRDLEQFFGFFTFVHAGLCRSFAVSTQSRQAKAPDWGLLMSAFAKGFGVTAFARPSSLSRRSSYAGHARHEILAGCAMRSPKGEAWWAHKGSNLGPLPCEGNALPLSYAPGRPVDEARRVRFTKRGAGVSSGDSISFVVPATRLRQGFAGEQANYVPHRSLLRYHVDPWPTIIP
jgi:hypothetical protein